MIFIACHLNKIKTGKKKWLLLDHLHWCQSILKQAFQHLHYPVPQIQRSTAIDNSNKVKSFLKISKYALGARAKRTICKTFISKM